MKIIFYIFALMLLTRCGPAGFSIPKSEISSVSANFRPVESASPGDPMVWQDSDPLLKFSWGVFNQGDFFTGSSSIGVDIHKTESKRQGLVGKGVTVMIVDTGIDLDHPDLAAQSLVGQHLNFLEASPHLSDVSPPIGDSDYENGHGTFVAGIIAAEANNGIGTQGVAPGAKFAGANLIGGDLASWEFVAKSFSANVDISNNSWGAAQTSLMIAPASLADAITAAGTEHRGGKGTVFVKSSGNDFVVSKTFVDPRTQKSTKAIRFGNSEFNTYSNVIQFINVGALTFDGLPAEFSSPGANLWLAAPGGDLDGLQILSTDRQGCGVGFSNNTPAYASRRFKNPLNNNCDYAVGAGTSFAAPMVAGAIALMLEANPNLNWRDIKHILAKTAVKIHGNADAISYPKDDEETLLNVDWEAPWIKNKAGFNFHNFFGFGMLDTDAAVALAKSMINSNQGYLSEAPLKRITKASGSISISIPDMDATGASATQLVSEALIVEAVTIKLSISHKDIGDLAVMLTSPSGTKSIVIPFKNALAGEEDFLNESLLTNAFYGESATGSWKLTVLDANRGITGRLNSWSLIVDGR